MRMDFQRRTSKATSPVNAENLLSDLRAEQAVLGAMLLVPETFGQVAEFLRTTDFVDVAHRTIYAAAMRIAGRGEPIDPVTLLAELRPIATQGEPWAALLASLARGVPHAHHATHYARIVWRATKRRQLLAVLEYCQEQLAKGLQAEDVLTLLHADLADITHQ